MSNCSFQRTVKAALLPTAEFERQASPAMPEDFKRARNRKQSTKLARSKQLGIDSPRVIEGQV